MRSLSQGLAAALAGDATTLCRCWRLTRRDGTIMGFTDHDRDLAFAGATFRAATGLDAAEAESAAGLAVAGGDVHGALADDGILEADIEAGAYDAASVEVWLVDWRDVSRRVLLEMATIGEVRRSEYSFVAELRSLAAAFDQEQGRQFQRNCAADLGDARCRIDLTAPAYATPAAVTAVEGPGVFAVSPDAFFADGFFTDGTLVLPDGARATIKLHERVAAGERIALWSAPRFALSAGARVTLRAGCDKSPETCRSKFANIVNFRGFPHMPGNDVVAAYPAGAARPLDGGSLFR